MPLKKRRDREIENMKHIIIEAAENIIATDGIDGLSIRKIARQIEYSPATIYHYFDDKEEILNVVMQKGYAKILKAISANNLDNLKGKEKLVEMSKNYIRASIAMSDEYMNALLNTSQEALQYTSSLFKGASSQKPALSILYQCIKEIDENKNASDDELELIAQMIAVSTFGLIVKISVEKDLDEEQIERLINYFVEETVLKIAIINKKERKGKD
ncbi:MAG: TetR/AcrR family transcriptional regulator [Eubacteriales bacterium]|nr:TetR/AcrR family transcriptional regulator [Eubacteriales bacterium]